MSKFKVLIIVGVAVGVLGGGLVALIMSGKRTASTAAGEPVSPATASPSTPIPNAIAAGTSARTEPVASAPQRAVAASATGGDPEALNERGKMELFASRFAEAEPLFRRAFELDPQPKYGFNLATALFQQAKLDEALGAIAQLRTVELTPEVRSKVEKLLVTVMDECSQGGPPCTALSAAAPPSKGIRASNLNDEGKGLLLAGKYLAATAKFREAFTLVTNPKYLFNLATSLYQEGKFQEALTALDTMAKFEVADRQLELAGKLRVKIVDECKVQGLDCR